MSHAPGEESAGPASPPEAQRASPPEALRASLPEALRASPPEALRASPPEALRASPHEVLRALAARARAGSQPGSRGDGLRIALAIEGGGMRGTVSAGMALALHELGLVPAFDALYGASAGAITGAWLLSRPEGLHGWTEPAYARTLIRRSAALRGRPVADVRALIEDLYQTTFPMDFAAVLASPVEFHPLATDAATGQSTDLRPLISDPAGLRLALQASAALPLLAGPPVTIAGRRFYDAGVSESIPYRTALTQGATYLLVLRSRRAQDALAPARHDPATAPEERTPAAALAERAQEERAPAAAPEGLAPDAPAASRMARLLARTTLRRESPEFRAVFLARESRLAADDIRLSAYESAQISGPAVYSIRPAPDSPAVGRLATDGPLLRAAFEAGRAATHAAFRLCELPDLPPTPAPPTPATHTT
jgi:predicted patatin/cPLA2 family phospholipase